MTPEAQRIAIAEVCGKDVKMCPTHHSRTCCGRSIPDYLNDLNAMHEAEKVLTQDQWWLYLCNLRDTFNPLPGDPRDKVFVHATAAQRAEAFLKCLGLWKE